MVSRVDGPRIPCLKRAAPRVDAAHVPGRASKRSSNALRGVLCCLLWLSNAAVMAQSPGLDDIVLITLPAQPLALETLRVRLPGSVFDQTAAQLQGVSMPGGNRIVVDLRCGDPCISLLPPEMPARDVVLGQFPAGVYTLEVFLATAGRPAAEARLLARRTVTVSDRPAQPGVITPPNRYDYTDLWWDPNESGWGLSIYQRPDASLFAAFYTYDEDHRAAFYTVQGGHWIDCATYAARLYRSAGSPAVGPHDPADTRVIDVGAAQLHFQSPADRNCADAGAYAGGRFRYTIDGRTRDRPISRVFRPRD